MNKLRLDQLMAEKGIVSSRSQAESYIKLGYVKVYGETIRKPGFFVSPEAEIKLDAEQQYVSRAALKLAGAADIFNLDFKDKTVLDVGSSTGGFTEYALKNGAEKVIAVDVGRDQLHPSLRNDNRVELHENTDIRDVETLSTKVNLVLVDVSFISLREVLPYIKKLAGTETQIIAMLKPQFEAGRQDLNKGVVKNDRLRRRIVKDFELWLKKDFRVAGKADSQVAGAKGNLERFYLLEVSEKVS